jgi:hypothetical protein
MPLALLFVGILFVVIAYRGKQGDAAALLAEEFRPPNGFIQWGAAIGILAALGYVPVIRPIMRGMIGLVILVMLVSNRGFFSQFNNQLRAPSGNAPAPSNPLPSNPLPGTPGTPPVTGPLTPLQIPPLRF